MSRVRKDWVDWNTRISKDLSDELMEIGENLHKEGKIKKIDRYNICRWILSNAMEILDIM